MDLSYTSNRSPDTTLSYRYSSIRCLAIAQYSSFISKPIQYLLLPSVDKGTQTRYKSRSRAYKRVKYNTVMIGKSQNQPVNQIRRKLAWMRGSFLGRTLVSCGHFRYFPYIGRIFPQCIDTQPAIFFGIGIFYIFIPYGIQMKCIFLWIFHIPQYFFIPRAQIVFTGNSSRIIPYNFLIQVKRYFIPQ